MNERNYFLKIAALKTNAREESSNNEKLLSLSRQNSPVASMYVAEPLTPRVPAHSLGLDPSVCAKGKNLNL